MRTIDFFRGGAALYPDNPAFVDDTGRLSYAEADAAANRIGAAIKGHGYRKGTHVGILAPNSNIAFIALLGLFSAECVWLPINPRNPVAVNAELLSAFDCELLLYHGNYAAEAEQIVQLTSIREAVCVSGVQSVGAPLDAWMEGQPQECRPGPEQDGDLFAIFPTGGTTGRSKGVMITHRNVECMSAHMWAHFRYHDRTNHLVIAPMTHTAGLFGFLHFPRGGCNTILPGADLPRILDKIERERITHLFLPPTVLYMLLEYPDIEKKDFSSLQHFFGLSAKSG